MPKKDKISLLGQSYVLDILVSLSKKPKRFKQLSKVCPNERTRSKKLKKLIEANLVTTIALKVGKRYFVHYALTEKGEKIISELSKLKAILEKNQ
jgi:DNA-binding HxlR family transcriptional regulator